MDTFLYEVQIMASEPKIIQAYHRKCKGEGRINSQHCGKKKGILLKGIRIRRFWLSARILDQCWDLGIAWDTRTFFIFFQEGFDLLGGLQCFQDNRFDLGKSVQARNELLQSQKA